MEKYKLMRSFALLLAMVPQALLLSLVPARPAHAVRGEATNLAAIRHQFGESATTPQDSLATIEGTLKCTLIESNVGKPCRLELTDSDTSRTYDLTGNSQLMRLYQDGARKVSIRGRLPEGDGTLEIIEAERR